MAKDKLQLDGIFVRGYGVIPRLVMQDNNLDIGAKGLYAYLCSFTGSENSCYPSREKICHDLNIGKDTLARYSSQLTAAGYLRIDKVRENGRFLHNLYVILSDTLSPCPQKSDTEIPCTEKPCMEKPCAENPATINSNFINNSTINSNLIKDIPASEKHRYGRYENVLLSDEDYAKLREEFSNDYTERIERLSEYIASKGAKYKNHLATIRSWARRDIKEHQQKTESDGWAYIAAVGKGEIL